MGTGLLFSPFLWFWEDGSQVWAAFLTVAHRLAHVLSELPGSNKPLGLWAHSTSETSSHAQFHLATQSLGKHSSNHPQGAGESSLQSSCLPFLTSARLFTQPSFPASLEAIQVRVWHSPTPPFSRCRPAPQFLWCWPPQSSWMYTASMCLSFHLYSPQPLLASRFLLVPGCPPCSGKGGSWWSNSPPSILWQTPGQGATVA